MQDDTRPTAKLPPEPPPSMQTRIANRVRALENAVREGRVDAERAARILDLIGGGE